MACRLGQGEDCFTVTIDRLTLAAGDKLALTGPSGCGKSTVLALLGLALRPSSAKIFEIGTADILALWRGGRERELGRLRSRVMGFVPQTGGLLPFLSLRSNIALPLDLARRPDAARVQKLATTLGIEAALDRLPSAVSVGQRQRAAVARAVVHLPSIILADEPTASVHPGHGREALALLQGMAVSLGAAVVIATHDLALAEAAGFTNVPLQVREAGLDSHVAWPC